MRKAVYVFGAFVLLAIGAIGGYLIRHRMQVVMPSNSTLKILIAMCSAVRALAKAIWDAIRTTVPTLDITSETIASKMLRASI